MNEPQPKKKYHFGTMSVGDSIAIPIVGGDKTAALRALKAAHAYGARHKRTFFGYTETKKGLPYQMVIKRYD